MRKKILIIICILLVLIITSATTYSAFKSEAEASLDNQGLADFVFNSERKDNLSIDVSDLTPSSKKEYLFSVKNADDQKVSNVVINYQITIKTMHFMPLDISLQVKEDQEYKEILNCDESYTRNDNNELVCNTEVFELNYKKEKQDDYKLVLTFPEAYSDIEYSNLVDYYDIEINSWQKIEKK